MKRRLTIAPGIMHQPPLLFLYEVSIVGSRFAEKNKKGKAEDEEEEPAEA